jgi:hypothetical protein
MAVAGGGNALFVLRMIWQGQSSRLRRTRFSTAVIDRESAHTKSSSTSLFPGLKALASSSNTSDAPAPVNFLEEESTEYNVITTTLPSRDLSPRPIPWPTIFAHPESSDAVNHPRPRARLCDPLARLVAEKDLVSAQKIYHELRSHKAPIMHRSVYLEAAAQSLEARDTERFMFWFRMYPNRPATRSHPGLKAVWMPLVNTILARHGSDLEFMESFLLEAARKGLLPVVITPMLQHLTFIMDPTQSRAIFERAFTAYLANTTPKNSDAVSQQGLRHRTVAQGQVDIWWETYHSLCDAQGWVESEAATRHQLGTPTTGRPSPRMKRRDLVAQAIAEPPSARELADLIWDIQCGTPEKVDDFKQKFINPAKAAAGAPSLSPAARQVLWTRATMIMYARAKDHAKVIEAYQSTFTWYGLPDHPLRLNQVDAQSDKTLIYPHKTVITTLMPSLLATLPTEDLTTFHQSYLASSTSLPPVLQPDGHIHNTFVNEIAHRVSVEAVISAVESIVAQGYDPGSQSMTSLLLAFARKRMMGDMYGLLEAMEREDEFASNDGDPLGRAIPPPTVETYDWLAKSLRIRAPEDAARLAKMKEEYFGDRERAEVESGPEKIASTG